MPKRVEVERQAEEDLREAIAWYEERSVGLGDLLYEEVVEVLDHLSRDLVAAVVGPGNTDEEPVRRVFLKRFPYAVVFLDDPDARRVIAFAHFKRKPEYWRT